MGAANLEHPEATQDEYINNVGELILGSLMPEKGSGEKKGTVQSQDKCLVG